MTTTHVGKCMLAKETDVARVESLGFIEIRFAPVPLAAPARDHRERLKNAAAIREKLMRLFKVAHRGIVILQAGIMIITFGMERLAEVRLESQRGFGSLP